MKIKWVELTEDDPLFKLGLIISNQSHRLVQTKKNEIKHKKPTTKWTSSRLKKNK